MKVFKSAASVEQVRDHPSYETVRDALLPIVCPRADRAYDPEEDGYLVLVEPGDQDRELEELDLPYELSEIPLEAVTRMDGHYYALYLANNEFGISFLIPDADWLDGRLRARLEEHLDP